ncbi:MAG: hypothetical protein APF84_08110 [Gracilibacter sp. BRH_c7a]|nr:MAG: hypothetical protein APF84_08110 [Gracilibacter sp. BRH_c7a]
MSISNLQRQHTEIAKIIEEIQRMLDDKTVTDNSNQISLNIGTLAGKLQNHLLLEDKFLYPSLLNHRDQHIQTISKRFMEEMGNLKEVFTTYKNKYMIANNIRSNPQNFIKDSNAVFVAIQKRVVAEESELYPIV